MPNTKPLSPSDQECREQCLLAAAADAKDPQIGALLDKALADAWETEQLDGES